MQLLQLRNASILQKKNVLNVNRLVNNDFQYIGFTAALLSRSIEDTNAPLVKSLLEFMLFFQICHVRIGRMIKQHVLVAYFVHAEPRQQHNLKQFKAGARKGGGLGSHCKFSSVMFYNYSVKINHSFAHFLFSQSFNMFISINKECFSTWNTMIKFWEWTQSWLHDQLK